MNGIIKRVSLIILFTGTADLNVEIRSEPDRPTSSEIAYDEDTMSLLKRQQEAYNTRAEAAMNHDGINLSNWNLLSGMNEPCKHFSYI